MLEVSAEESGQKLLQFLQRRLNLPQPLLHRWIRTGQVRCNMRRCKPFDRIQTGDSVRMPPFTSSMVRSAQAGTDAVDLPPLPPIVAETNDLLIFNKPAGMPVHPGTGHTDSLATRLGLHSKPDSFRLTPAHRLDKETSGLIVVAKSYTGLHMMHELFVQHTALGKEYLAWVHGNWPHTESVRLQDTLEKLGPIGQETVQASERGKDASCTVRCLQQSADKSLLLVNLETGRTHQIRAQLSMRGFPVIGDPRYGGARHPQGLLLHAFRLSLPTGESFCAPAPWTGDMAAPEIIE